MVITINRGEWREFGVSKWDDLLMIVFSRTNRTSKYDGIEGLNYVVNELGKFKKNMVNYRLQMIKE